METWEIHHDLDPFFRVLVRADSWEDAVAAGAALLGRPVSDAQLVAERVPARLRAA